jgi:hypothetical protein
MKRINLFGLMLVLFLPPGFATGERNPAGGRANAMGGVSVSSDDIWSVLNNQAGTAWLKVVSAGLSSGNRFMLKELMLTQIGIALPTAKGTFGLCLSRFGNDQYHELKTGASYARKFGKRFSAGLQLDYLYTHIADGFGNSNLLNCEVGLLYREGDRLCIGIQLVNPVPVKISGNPTEYLPAVICFGISYRFSANFLFAAEVEKETEQPVCLRGGAEYNLGTMACIRLGVSTGPASFTFGFGLKFGRMRMDFASGYHQALGFSPAGSISYSLR